MVECDQSYWNGFSTCFESITYFLVVLRTYNAAVVIRSVFKTKRTTGRNRWITISVHTASVATSLLLAVAVTLGHRFVKTNKYDAPLISFLFINYLGVFTFDVWILLRDRAVQCVFFRTPNSFFAFAVVLVAIFVMAAILSVSHVPSLRYNTTGGFVLFLIYYNVQLALVLWMTFVFTRPLRDTRSAVDVGLSKLNDSIRSVINRTAIGCAVHFATSAVYIITLALYTFAENVCLGVGNHYSASFSVSVLGFILHMNLSHRDDLTVDKALRLLVELFRQRCSQGENDIHSTPVETTRSSIAKLGNYIASLDEEERLARAREGEDASVIKTELTGTDFSFSNPAARESTGIGN